MTELLPAPDLDELVVLVPSQRVRPGDETIVLELRELDGRLTLLAFRGLDALVAACGDAQPWAGLTLGSARQVAESMSAVLVLDLPLVLPDHEVGS